MVQLIKKTPIKIITKTEREVITKVQSKNGECDVNISLELTINLTSEGLALTAGSTKASDEEEVNWAVPDFSHETIDFGKEA